ncbi:MAG: rhomboid family intramembrane serine protease, partial [Thermosphaera sp.]
AISAVLGAFLILFPHTRVSLCMFIFFLPICLPLPSSLYLIIWFAEQVIYGYLNLGGVAYFAHAGGFVAGLALVWLVGSGPIRRLKSRLAIPFEDYLHSIGVFPRKFYSLGTGTKILVTILLLALLTGFYMSWETNRAADNVYALNVSAGDSRDTVILYQDRGNWIISQSPVSTVRFVINRLFPADLIVNPKLSGEILRDKYVLPSPYYVEINGVRTPVELYIVEARYDDNGVVVSFTGRMRSYYVIILSSGEAYLDTSNPVSLEFNLERENVEELRYINYSIYASALLTIIAVGVVLASDRFSVVTDAVFE